MSQRLGNSLTGHFVWSQPLPRIHSPGAAVATRARKRSRNSERDFAPVKSTVKRSAVTQWNVSPFVLGATSVAAPGAQGSRKILMEPLGSLFLAGEAAHETLWGTVGGAWESGERAAEAALRRIGALTPEPAAQPASKGKRKKQ